MKNEKLVKEVLKVLNNLPGITTKFKPGKKRVDTESTIVHQRTNLLEAYSSFQRQRLAIAELAPTAVMDEESVEMLVKEHSKKREIEREDEEHSAKKYRPGETEVHTLAVDTETTAAPEHVSSENASASDSYTVVTELDQFMDTIAGFEEPSLLDPSSPLAPTNELHSLLSDPTEDLVVQQIAPPVPSAPVSAPTINLPQCFIDLLTEQQNKVKSLQEELAGLRQQQGLMTPDGMYISRKETDVNNVYAVFFNTVSRAVNNSLGQLRVVRGGGPESITVCLRDAETGDDFTVRVSDVQVFETYLKPMVVRECVELCGITLHQGSPKGNTRFGLEAWDPIKLKRSYHLCKFLRARFQGNEFLNSIANMDDWTNACNNVAEVARKKYAEQIKKEKSSK